MKLTKITRISESQPVNEGPFDFMRGAAGAAGRKVGGAVAGAARSVANTGREVVAAGQAASAQGNLEKAVANLAALLAKLPQQPQQEPAAQQAAPQGKPSDATPDAFRTTEKPRARAGKYGPELTFNSYMQATYGDPLTEGPLDFIRGVGKSLGDKARQQINNYADRPSVFKDIYQAGVDASRQGNQNRDANAQKALQTQIQQAQATVQQLAAKLGPEALMNAIKKMGGNQANRITKMVGQQAA